MHVRRYLHVTAGHQGIHAAQHICNIRPLKVKFLTPSVEKIVTLHGFKLFIYQEI